MRPRPTPRQGHVCRGKMTADTLMFPVVDTSQVADGGQQELTWSKLGSIESVREQIKKMQGQRKNSGEFISNSALVCSALCLFTKGKEESNDVGKAINKYLILLPFLIARIIFVIN